MNSPKRLISFFFIVVVLYLGAMWVLSKIKRNDTPLVYTTNNMYIQKGGRTYRQFQEFDTHKEFDAIFIGSSTAYRHYDPIFFSIKGVDAYNLGTSSQSINHTYEIIKEYINVKKHHLLIVDLNPGALNNVFESQSHLIANLDSDQAVVNIVFNDFDFKLLNPLITRFFNKTLPPLQPIEEDYIGKGFSTKNDTFKLEELQEALNKKPAHTQKPLLSKTGLRYVEDLITYCKSKQINLIFVVSPKSDCYSEGIHKKFHNEIDPLFRKHNVPVFDFSKTLNLSTQQHFYDCDHMNYEGVKIFNKALYRTLLKKKILK